MVSGATVVGIGFSAGGLAAVETFFENIPARSGLTFVVVQHLPRDYKSQLKKILGKHTAIPIESITDSMFVQPNHIYVLDTDQYVKIWDSHLYFVERPQDIEMNLAIDTLFFSMAMEKKEKAIGIIFSGTGSDGAKGGFAIHEAGGKLLVQDPASAAFEFMPRSAIEADQPYAIATPKQLAKDLIELTERKS